MTPKQHQRYVELAVLLIVAGAGVGVFLLGMIAGALL